MNSAKGAAQHDSRAQSYYDVGDYERAIVDATHAIELKPDTAVYYRNRGRIFSGAPRWATWRRRRSSGACSRPAGTVRPGRARRPSEERSHLWNSLLIARSRA
jgi:hypothetical protein